MATCKRSSRRSSGPARWAASSWRSPSWPSRATRPRTSCSSRPSSRPIGRRSTWSRAPRAASPWSWASWTSATTSSTRRRSFTTVRAPASTTSSTCPTTASSTRTATSRRAPRRPSSPWARPSSPSTSARTSGTRRDRPPRRRWPGPSWSSTSTARPITPGRRAYVRKNGFARVVIGLSGGIDSSLVAAIAVEALGRENVAGVGMPSPYSSAGTRRDAQRVAKNLGIEYLSIPITPILRAYKRALARAFKGLKEDVTEENLQARIRGNLLMALSNKFGWLVLTTGNKSEYSVGYTTLYGDMAGGFAVIKDVPKMLVYEVSRHVNASAGRAIIPEGVLERAPSAELRPDQTDQDTLPPYAELDPILESYVEEDRGVNDLVARGFAPESVRRVVAMVDKNEYKRRQAPIGVKDTPRAVRRHWRPPIVNRFREQ